MEMCKDMCPKLRIRIDIVKIAHLHVILHNTCIC